MPKKEDFSNKFKSPKNIGNLSLNLPTRIKNGLPKMHKTNSTNKRVQESTDRNLNYLSANTPSVHNSIDITKADTTRLGSTQSNSTMVKRM